MYKLIENEFKLITMDVDEDAPADGGRDAVGGYAEVGAHF